MHNIRTSGRSERLQKMRAVVIPSWKGDAMPASRFGRIRLDVSGSSGSTGRFLRPDVEAMILDDEATRVPAMREQDRAVSTYGDDCHFCGE